MGYRLDVRNESDIECKNSYYGTKHYGYSFCFHDEGMEYESYRYLFKLGKVTEDVTFICSSPEIILTADEFEHFIKLYAKEFMDMCGYNILEEPIMVDLINSKERKIISWG